MSQFTIILPSQVLSKSILGSLSGSNKDWLSDNSVGLMCSKNEDKEFFQFWNCIKFERQVSVDDTLM